MTVDDRRQQSQTMDGDIMKQFFKLLAVFGIAVLLLGSIGAAQAADGPTVTVAVDALNLRQGPGTGYTIVDVLRSGDSATVTGRDAAGTWYQVKLADGRTGWVNGSFVQLSGDATGVPVVQAPAVGRSLLQRFRQPKGTRSFSKPRVAGRFT